MNYVLIGLVAIVWGLILYKAFVYLTLKDEEEIMGAETVIEKPSADDYSPVGDTSDLMMNYRDPFSPGFTKDTVAESPRRTAGVRAAVSQARPLFNWSFVKYEGFVGKPGSGELIALVRINGKSLMLSEGEQAEKVRLLKNLRDSIKVSSGGHTAYLNLNQR